MDQSLALFQKRDDLDELEGFQQQELSKVKHMVLTRAPSWTTTNSISEEAWGPVFVDFCSILQSVAEEGGAAAAEGG